MKIVKFASLILLGLIWLFLAWVVVNRGGGLTLKNIIVLIASGVCVFIPLMRKFGDQQKN